MLPNTTTEWNGFGSSVSLSNGMLMVGAPRYRRSNIPFTGRTYIYKLDDVLKDTFVLSETIENPRLINSQFGKTVEVNNNLFGIGTPEFQPAPIASPDLFVGEAYLQYDCDTPLKFKSVACFVDDDDLLDNFAPNFYNQNVTDPLDGRVIVQRPNLRIPFESILTLKNNVPEDQKIWMMAPEYYTG